MGGLETELTEWAFDKYDEISKGAFEAYDRVKELKDVPGAKKPKNFNEGVAQLLIDAGAPDDFIVKIGNDAGSGDWLDAFHDVAVEAEEWAADSAVVGVLSAMGLSAWIPAAEQVVGAFRTSWNASKEKAESEKMGLLKKGHWVYINNGKPAAPIPGWKDGLRRRLKVEEMPGDKVTVGFYIGPANRKARVQVFNFDVFREQEVHLDDVAPCGVAKARLLESNTVMAGIRDLKCYEAGEKDQMESICPTDPGTEVVYEEALYHIVTSRGSNVLIEDEHGQRLVVTLNKLTPGRVTHTNSWNYGADTAGNFQADGAARIYTGQWVWIPARHSLVKAGATTNELACVWKIQGAEVHVFLGIDGRKAIVNEVWPVHELLADVINKKKTFVLFKEQAVTGGDTQTSCLGPTDLLLCMGKTDEDAAKEQPTFLTAGERVQPKPTERRDTAGDQATKLELDAVEEVANKTGVAPAEVLRAQYDDGDDRIVGTYSSGDSLFGYAMMAGLGLLIYNSVDFGGGIFAGVT